MRLLALALLLLAGPFAHGASFDCNKAQNTRETTVCSSAKLSRLDDDLAQAYARVRSQLTPASAALVQADQREWLARVDKLCPAHNPEILNLADCFTEHYNIRLDQLTTGVQRTEGLLFYTRAHVVFVAGQPPAQAPDRAPNDPGFGYGEFAWPQIDAPDAEHALWNKAVYETAVSIESMSPDSKSPTLDGSVDAQGYSFGSFQIFAANANLIEINFYLSTYGWGAAHPLTNRTTFLWSLDEHRALGEADILRTDTPWQTALIQPAIAKLLEQRGEDGFWKDKELHDGVAETVEDSRTWNLSRTGLIITFGQYAVTPYAGGTPDITFTWKELGPYLNRAFAPERMPIPLQGAK